MRRTIYYLSAAIIIVALIVGGFLAVQRQKNAQRMPERAALPRADLKITLIEGWTLRDMGNYLREQNIVSVGDFLSAEQSFDASAYAALASRPKNADLQGFIFPDTYLIPPLSSSSPVTVADGIISRALDNFAKKITPAMIQQAQDLHRSVFEIVTLASIIERETGRDAVTAAQKQALDDERKIIAGIFYNRLSSGMPLESDATINYVTGKNDPAVSEVDTKISSPYNTYQHAGLPPGPICNPSLSSLMAALYPTKTDYYYFLHKQPSGEPVYSKTYEEHLQNKAEYLK